MPELSASLFADSSGINSELTRPGLAWVLCAALLGVSAVYAAAYGRGFGRRPAWAITVVVALMWSNRIVASTQWAADNQTSAHDAVGDKSDDFGGAAVRTRRRNGDRVGGDGHEFRGQELLHPQPVP